MKSNDPAALQDVATDDSIELERRDVDALTRCMTVLEDAPGLYEVVSDSGRAYTVEPELGVCTCPDREYRNAQCIHIRRVAYATGRAEIPAWVNRDSVDDQLGMHVDGAVFASDEPEAVLADGGGIIVASDDGEILDEDEDGPEITVHYESYEQGAERFHRCSGCGAETVFGREQLLHGERCPRRGGR